MVIKLQGLVLAAAMVLPAVQTTRFDSSWIFGKSTEQSLMDACENVLKERLKTPSKYRRLDAVSVPTRRATLDEYLGWEDPAAKAEDIAAWAIGPNLKKLHDTQVQLFKASKEYYVARLIKYEADNSFGVPLQSNAKCTWVTTDPQTFSALDSTLVRVNGYSSTEWTVHQMRELKPLSG